MKIQKCQGCKTARTETDNSMVGMPDEQGYQLHVTIHKHNVVNAWRCKKCFIEKLRELLKDLES